MRTFVHLLTFGHILNQSCRFHGTYADEWWFWFFTACFVVVRLARMCLDVYFSWGLFLIKFSQIWCDKCEKIKETIFHTETHGSTAWQITQEGRENWEHSEFDQFKSWTRRPWPKASKRTLLWSTWNWRITKSELKGQRLGVWWVWWEKRS